MKYPSALFRPAIVLTASKHEQPQFRNLGKNFSSQISMSKKLSNIEEETEELPRTKILWSGLSESNRHLNLGKVPYYHYTKAARTHLFITRPHETRQVHANSLFPLELFLARLRTAYETCPIARRLYDR